MVSWSSITWMQEANPMTIYRHLQIHIYMYCICIPRWYFHYILIIVDYIRIIWLVVSNIWIIFHHIWDVILPIDSYFSRWVLNHQPDIIWLNIININQQYWWYFLMFFKIIPILLVKYSHDIPVGRQLEQRPGLHGSLPRSHLISTFSMGIWMDN